MSALRGRIRNILHKDQAQRGRSTHRFVRRVSVTMLSAVLVVGIAGLAAMYVSTLRSDTITNVVDPAGSANETALQVMTDGQSRLRDYLLTGGPAELAPYAASAELADALNQVKDAELTDPKLATLVQAENAAAQTWLASYADLATKAEGGRRAEAISHQAQADSDFVNFRVANTAVKTRLDATRAALKSEAASLRSAAELVLGVLILAALTILSAVGALASRFLVGPLHELSDVVERLRGGQPDARAHIDRGPEEVRSVAVQVNALADEVESWRSAQMETERLRRVSSEVSHTVREELDLDAVLRAPAIVGPAFGADRCWLRLASNGRFTGAPREWAREGLDLLGSIPMAGDDPFANAQELWTSETVLMDPDLQDDLDHEDADLQLFVATTGARGLLVVPIGAGDQVLGLLTWVMCGEPRIWTAPEVAAAQQVAGDLGRAIVHAELYAQQLQIVERLQTLDRHKDDFLSTVSHELRTPLTSIKGYLELVREGVAGEVPPEMDRMLEVVDRNARRLRTLIEDLLVISRIEDGLQGQTRVPVDMARILGHAVDTVQPDADATGVELTIDQGPVGLQVIGDASHLDIVVLNVLSNAVKFTPAGGRVQVNVWHDEWTGEAVLSCADTGIGIPESDQAELFTRFFRASNATLNAIPGTGLGLSVIKAIVESHGGTVKLSSREGKGTIVAVRLPGASRVPQLPASVQI